MSSYLLGVANQGQSAIEVYDLALGELNEKARVWRHECPEYNIAGLKLRRYKGEQVVITSYGWKSAEMLAYPSGNTLWKTNNAGNNPHSIELIPLHDKYILAVASSDGAQIAFFDPEGDGSDALFRLPYQDAHGVLYDPTLNCLWLWGSTRLCKCDVKFDGTELKAEITAEYIQPSRAGHDLAPVYGDKNRLWCSTAERVYQFDKTDGTFRTDYKGSDSILLPHIKGIGNFVDGSLAWIFPDGTHRSWNSSKIYCNLGDGDKTLSSHDDAFYKIRVWNEDYQ